MSVLKHTMATVAVICVIGVRRKKVTFRSEKGKDLHNLKMALEKAAENDADLRHKMENAFLPKCLIIFVLNVFFNCEFCVLIA